MSGCVIEVLFGVNTHPVSVNDVGHLHLELWCRLLFFKLKKSSRLFESWFRYISKTFYFDILMFAIKGPYTKFYTDS